MQLSSTTTFPSLIGFYSTLTQQSSYLLTTPSSASRTAVGMVIFYKGILVVEVGIVIVKRVVAYVVIRTIAHF